MPIEWDQTPTPGVTWDDEEPASSVISPPFQPSFGQPDPEKYRADLAQGAKSTLAGALSFPFVDRGVAGAGAALGIGEGYEPNLAALREFIAAGQAANPGAAFAGSMLTPVPLPRGAGAVAKLGQEGISGVKAALSALGRGAKTGALLGTAQGASSAPDLTDLSDVATRSAKGLGLGAALGGVAGLPAAAVASRAGTAAGQVERGAQAQGILTREEAAAASEAARVAGNRQRAVDYQDSLTAAKQQVAANKQLAAAETEQRVEAAFQTARAPGPEKALPYFGLEDSAGTRAFGTRLPGEAIAEGAVLWGKPLPGAPGKTWGDLAQLPIRKGREAATAIRETTGARLGTLRDELQVASKGAPLDGRELGRRFRDLVGPNPSEGEKGVIAELQGIVKRASPQEKPSGLVDLQGNPIEANAPIQLDAKGLRSVIRSVEEAMGLEGGNVPQVLKDADGRLLFRARQQLVEKEQELFTRYRPDLAPEAEQLRAQYREARIVEGGKIKQEQRLNSGASEETATRGLPTRAEIKRATSPLPPEAVAVPQKPASTPKAAPPGKSETEQLSRERSRLEQSATPNRFANTVLKEAGGAAGGAAGFLFGGGFPGTYMGREGGYRAAEQIADRYFKKVTPTIKEIAALSGEGRARLQRLAPVLDKLSGLGDRAARAYHQSLLVGSADYRALVEEIGE